VCVCACVWCALHYKHVCVSLCVVVVLCMVRARERVFVRMCVRVCVCVVRVVVHVRALWYTVAASVFYVAMRSYAAVYL